MAELSEIKDRDTGNVYGVKDAAARQRVVALSESSDIICTASGSVISLNNSSNRKLSGLRIYGQTIQGGTPAPDVPVSLNSVGENVTVTVCGRNLLDTTTTSNHYYTEAGELAANASFVLFDWIPVKQGEILSFSAKYTGSIEELLRWAFFDTDKKFVSRHTSPAAKAENAVITATANGFIRVFLNSDNYDITTAQLTYGNAALAYEAFSGGHLTINAPNGLRGIPVTSGGNYTDENGQQWICDEMDFSGGKHVRRIGEITFDGSADEAWQTANTASGSVRFLVSIPGIRPGDAALVADLLNSHFTVSTANNIYTANLEACAVNQQNLIIHTAKIQSVDALRAHLAAHPMTVVYVLAAPVETEKEMSSDEQAQYDALHTSYPNTFIFSDDGAGIEVTYTANTKSYIDDSLWHRRYDLPLLMLSGDMAEMTKEQAVTMNYQYNGRSGTCTVKWQGTSSLQYPKKNFTIKFDLPFEAKTGWGAQKRYCLKANFIDPSHARNIISAGLWSRIMGTRSDGRFGTLPNHGAIDGFPIILEINGEFWGLYTFNIPKDGWMFGLSDSTLTQAIVCAEGNSFNTASAFKEPANLNGTDFSLEYVSDESNSDWVKTSLNRLITACINSDGTDLDTTIAQYLDWTSAIDYFIFTCLIGGYDNIVKNYLLVTTDGTRWSFSAYDMDSTYGLEWTGKGFIAANTCAPLPANYATLHRVMDLIVQYKKDALKTRFNAIKSALHPVVVHYDFYNFTAGIPQIVFNEDWRRWPTIPGTSCNNIAQIMDWYRDRFDIVSAQIEVL